jgi:hypothetical protein
MSHSPSAEERKIAVLVAAMQDMHGEIEAMLKKMQTAASAAIAASTGIAQAGAAVVPAVTQATAQAVETGMVRAFADVAVPARGALEVALKPVVERFAQLERRTLQMEATARRAMTWFSAKWIALTAAGFVAMTAMAWAAVGWQRSAVNELTEQKTALEADIIAMQINAAELAKKGGRIKITDCGGRLCIVASKNQTGSFSEWHGLWNDAKTGQTMVIPNGY